MTINKLDKLKLELKRVTKRKADLEREIEEIQFEQDKQYIESRGFSFDKIYRVNPEWINWCKENNDFISISYTKYDYRITQLTNELGVRLTTTNRSGINIYVPFEFLIEVNPNH